MKAIIRSIFQVAITLGVIIFLGWLIQLDLFDSILIQIKDYIGNPFI